MKNLRITGITLKQDRKVYLSKFWTACKDLSSRTLLDRYFRFLDSCLTFKYDAEHSGKRSPIEQIDYWSRSLYKYDIIISGDIAKELGITVGDKVNIRLRLFGKTDDDYLAMYEKNPKKFSKYFDKQNLNDKKRILKELLEYDTTNDEVIGWLDKNYFDLVREVGLE